MKKSKKVQNDLTEMVFIIDRSGSMSGLEADTIGGFNSTINSQKEKEGRVVVSTVLFNYDSYVLHDRVDIDKIAPMSNRDYYAVGGTALLDAIGDAITHIKNIHKYAREEDVPEKTIFVITTDGMENASCKYNNKKIKSMVKDMQKKHGWEFLFLGANIDSFDVAENIGISKSRTANYSHDEEGVSASYATMSRAIGYYRDDDDCYDLEEIMIEEDKRRK